MSNANFDYSPILREYPRGVLLFNGPPQSGKDEAAKILQREGFEFTWEQFQVPLNQTIQNLFVLNEDHMAWLLANKDESTPLLNGQSWRSARISLAEHYLKPLYGKSIFGWWLLRRAATVIDFEDMIVVSDLGFDEEMDALLQILPPEKIFVVRIHRKGKEYKKDSRYYIDWSRIPESNRFEYHNDGTLEEYSQWLIELYKEKIPGYGG